MKCQSECDTYGDGKMRIAVITFWMLFAATSASAEYFNQHNIIKECARDNSFGSECYTYLAAYRDFMAFMVRATDADARRCQNCAIKRKMTPDDGKNLSLRRVTLLA